MKWLLLTCVLCVGCGPLKIQSTPNAAMQEWMAAVATWQTTMTDRINDHEHRLTTLEAQHAQP